jgi:hypothetical protein
MPGRTDISAPARVELQTCIGCGARDRAGTCTGACVEVRLDLVPAAEAARRRDELGALSAFAETGREALMPLAAEPPRDEAEARARWAELHDRAVAAIAAAPAVALAPPRDPVPVATTWWCATCDRIEAPQPCIGVCVRRPEPMASLDAYRTVDEAAAPLEAAARDRLALLRLVVAVRPRPGRARETWAALAQRAAALSA